MSRARPPRSPVRASAPPRPIEADFAALDARHPILLLPVRLETRFSAAARALLVRIYPDDVHVDGHRRALSAEERRACREQLGGARPSGLSEDQRRRAWALLTERFGANRAAWIWRVLEERGPDAPAPADEAAEPGAAHARVLPGRWAVLGYRDGRRVVLEVGSPIPEGLAVTPDPAGATPPAGSAGDGPAVDAGMRWLVDFEEAVRVGMAVRVPYARDPQLAARGLDQLIVLGVRTSDVPAQGRARIERLVAAHRYGPGLAFVPQGTPTNNASDTPAGFSARAGDAAARFDREVGPTRGRPGDRSNAEVLARALGLPAPGTDAGVLGRLEHADRREQLDAESMQAALWPATGGYFLEEMMRPEERAHGAAERATIEAARRHFTRYVRARGPLPAVRVGAQPYGVLPVTSLAQWAPMDAADGGFEGALAELLRSLLPFWTRAAADVPRLAGSDDPARDLVDTLRLQPVAGRHRVRQVFGPEFARTLAGHRGLAALAARAREQLFARPAADPRAVLRDLGLGGLDPVLAGCHHAQRSRPVTRGMVAGDPLPDAGRLDPDYLAWLLTASPSDVRHERFPGGFPPGSPAPLLYLLLRHATLLEHADAAWRYLERHEPGQGPWIEDELALIRERGADARRTFLERLGDRVSEPGVAARTLEQLLVRARDSRPELLGERFVAFWAALRHLAAMPASELDGVTREALDLVSHRLDAWITSLATRRLDRLRAEFGDGTYVGGFGVVEELRPRAAPPSEGFIHAPSLNQAATAAVLYNGFLAHRGDAESAPLALDLSSDRARRAVEILEGVRDGQTLGALLGYRFERSLLDGPRAPGIGRVVPAFRAAYPVAEGRVLDGLALARRFAEAGYRGVRDDVAAAAPALAPPAAGPDAGAIQEALAGLRDALDGVADALMAESVHQVVQGNAARAGAALDAVAGGAAAPPDLEFLRTPRRGVTIAHRLLLVAGATPARAAGWAADTPLARIEPSLDAVVSRLLGDAGRIRIWIEGPGAAGSVTLSLRDLGLGALDVLYRGDGQPFSSRVLEALARLHAGESAPASARVHFDRREDWPADAVAFDELEPLLAAIRTWLGLGRPLVPSDLALADEGPEPEAAWDVAELRARLLIARDGLRALRDRLRAGRDAVAAAPSPGPAGIRDLRRALADATGYRLPDSVPALLEPVALVTQADAVLAHADRRIAAAGAVLDGSDAATVTALDGVAGALFGEGLRVLPRFAPVGPFADLVARLLDPAASAALLGDDALAPERWLSRAARVREPAAAWRDVLRQAGILQGRSLEAWQVAQLPVAAAPGAERWVGRPLGEPLARPRTSLVAHVAAPGGSPAGGYCGLFVDGWSEVVPAATETTGVSFHFDTPGARAPNAWLLAVSPAPGGPGRAWSLDHLEAVLRELLVLVKIRGVDPSLLEELDSFLPAVYVAENAAGGVVATDLDRAGVGR